MKKSDFIFEEFKKLTSEEKLNLIAQTQDNPVSFEKEMKDYQFSDKSLQKKLEQLSESTMSCQ